MITVNSKQYMIVNVQLGSVVVDYETGEIKTFDSIKSAELFIRHRNLNKDVYRVEKVQHGSR